MGEQAISKDGPWLFFEIGSFLQNHGHNQSGFDAG
jgi:hypothetical protein